METIETINKKLSEEWTAKTLEDLRIQAEQSDTGIVFEAVREKDGRRFFMVMCVTGVKNIDYACRVMNVWDDRPTEDWSSYTLTEAVVGTAKDGVIGFEVFKGDSGLVSAVALIAADPNSCSIIGRLFDLPK